MFSRFLVFFLFAVNLACGHTPYRLSGDSYMIVCVQDTGCLVLEGVDAETANLELLDSSLVQLEAPGLEPIGVRIQGDGDFQVAHLRCSVTGHDLSCNKSQLDMSLGAVVASQDGRFHPASLLPLLAK